MVFNKLIKMIYYSISLFCTIFPIVFVFVLLILTWKWLYGVNLLSSPSARSTSKPRRSRHRRGATEIKTNAVDALSIPVSKLLYNSTCFICPTSPVFSVKSTPAASSAALSLL